MSYETQRIECARCDDCEGPFVKRTVAQFSASGARPDLTVYYCEPCAALMRPASSLGRFTDGH